MTSIAIFNTKLWALKVRGNIWATKEIEVMSKRILFNFRSLKMLQWIWKFTYWLNWVFEYDLWRKKVKLGNIWAGRIPQSLKKYSWKSNDFVIFFSRLRFLIEICQCWKVVQCYLEEKINFGVIFELKNTTCIKAKFDFSTMKLVKVHLNEIQNKNTCNLV